MVGKPIVKLKLYSAAKTVDGTFSSQGVTMRIQQLRDILAHLAQHHQDMKRLYQRLYIESNSARTKLLLVYLQQHQRHIANSIEDYITKAPHALLNTWYENVPLDHFTENCQAITADTTMDDEELIDLHLSLDNELLTYLTQAVDLAPTEKIHYALSQLLQVSQVQQHRLVHSVIRMQDI